MSFIFVKKVQNQVTPKSSCVCGLKKKKKPQTQDGGNATKGRSLDFFAPPCKKNIEKSQDKTEKTGQDKTVQDKCISLT